MDAKYACESCYSKLKEKCVVEDIIYPWCHCEEDYDLDCASYGYYEAPRTVYKCNFCLPPRESYCLVHGMHKIRISKEKPLTTSVSTN